MPVARSVPGVSRLHGAVRRWRRLFHAPGKIFFPGLQPLRQGTACRVGGRSRGSIAAVPVARSVPRVSRLHGAVRCCQRLFHAPGKLFANGEGEGGTGVERHSPDACDDVTARTRSGRAAYASVAGIVSGRKKSPLSTTAGRGADKRERGRMHRQRPMQGGRERRFRTTQRTDIRKTSVRCTLGCCGHSQL